MNKLPLRIPGRALEAVRAAYPDRRPERPVDIQPQIPVPKEQ